MTDEEAIKELISDLHWQIDQMRPRGIKNAVGHVYYPAYYIQGLNARIEQGGLAVRDYVRTYLYKPPSDGYQKLEDADSLDLACEALVADPDKPYAHLFSDEDRRVARKRLAPHQEAIDRRNAERRARIDAKRQEIRKEGVPRRSELDGALRSRRQPDNG